MASAEEVQEWKNKGNDCVRSYKYEEAVLHYTQAIKLDPKNFSLYSNRSLAFLKIKQYALAIEDASETIRLNSNWAKGYFRRAEVEFATHRYADAILSYSLALKLQPDDKSIIQSIIKTNQALQKVIHLNAQVPWVGAGVGIIVGGMIVIADQALTVKPTITNPLLMVLFMMTVAMSGYAIAHTITYYIRRHREELHQPVDLLADIKKDSNPDEEEEADPAPKEGRTHQKYTKAQTRQRYKKGRT